MYFRLRGKEISTQEQILGKWFKQGWMSMQARLPLQPNSDLGSAKHFEGCIFKYTHTSKAILIHQILSSFIAFKYLTCHHLLVCWWSCNLHSYPKRSARTSGFQTRGTQDVKNCTGSVNFFRASGHTPLPKKDMSDRKRKFSQKNIWIFLKELRKHVVFLLTLSFGMTKSASQYVNLEHVIARSEKLRFRSALASHSGQILKFFCSFLWHLAWSWRKHCESCNVLQRGLKIDIYCHKIIFFSPPGSAPPLPLPRVTEQHPGSPLVSGAIFQMKLILHEGSIERSSH